MTKDKTNKTIVYIDGQNFLYKAAEILINSNNINNKQDLTKIDIRFILDKILNKSDYEIRFYGVKRIKRRHNFGDDILGKSIRFSDNLRRIRNYLSVSGIDYIEAGQLKIRDSDVCKSCGEQDLRFQEKGVDVGLAVDMVKDSLSGSVDCVVLLSSDTDLLPAVKVVKGSIKEIIYVGFSDRLTGALTENTTKTEAIRDNEIIEAYNIANKTPRRERIQTEGL